ncbi:MAG: amidase [Candidatus Cloacimonadaceae bacterium]|nr:amidase [Candidatus Cloacimonadaceae bacterium]
MPLLDYVQDALQELVVKDAAIHSFLPEQQRESRLYQEAEKLLKLYPDPAARPPLFGILIGVKDLYRVDALPTQAGSKLPLEVFAGAQAALVTRLKQAGCLVLGKTVSTEFAYFSPGPTRNPINPEHTPGGSSSGSAAAVALGLCPLALGTQTIASISRPASYCGVFGFKPSFGRMPLDGIFPFAQSVDHAGLFTSALDDLAFAAPYAVDHWNPQSHQPLLKAVIPTGAFLAQAEQDVLEHFYQTIQKLCSLQLIETEIFEPIQELNERHRRLIAAEFALNHRKLYREYARLYSAPSIELIELGQKVTLSELDRLRLQTIELREHIHTCLKAQGTDLILCPGATSTAPLGLESTGSPLMSLPFTHAGVPTITMPDGSNHMGLPYSLQLASAFLKDESLLQTAQFMHSQITE